MRKILAAVLIKNAESKQILGGNMKNMFKEQPDTSRLGPVPQYKDTLGRAIRGAGIDTEEWMEPPRVKAPMFVTSDNTGPVAGLTASKGQK